MMFSGEKIKTETHEIIDREIMINGTQYQISLVSQDKKGCYDLSFSAENTGLIINKGIGQFYLLVDEIKKIVEELAQKEKIKEITFHASHETANLETIIRIQNQLLTKFKENPSFLDGFEIKLPTESISIKDGIVSSWYKFRSPGFPKERKRSIQQPDRPLQLILSDIMSLQGSILDRPYIQKIIEYTGIEVSKEDLEQVLEPTMDKKSYQRSLLYQRVLERKFPDLKYEVDNNNFKIIFDES